MPTKIITLTFNAVQENTYIVYDEESREAIIFDPGCFSNEEEQRLVAALDEHRLNPVQLINTHCHFDHVFGNAFVASTYGLQLGIHPLEEQLLTAAPVVVQAYGMPPMTASPKPGYFIHEGETVTLGDASFTALFCPGHSPGHLCFYNATEGYVIAGDVLFRESIGRTDLPLGDFDTLMGSIHTHLLPLPEDTVVYPGHGPKTTIGWERTHNPFLK